MRSSWEQRPGSSLLGRFGGARETNNGRRNHDIHKCPGTQEDWRWRLRASTEGTILRRIFSGHLRASTWLQTRSMWKIWQVSLRSRVRNRVRHQVPEPPVVGSAVCWSHWRLQRPRCFAEGRRLLCISDQQIRSAVYDEGARSRHADAKQVVDAEAQKVCPVSPRCGRRGTVLRVPR